MEGYMRHQLFMWVKAFTAVGCAMLILTGCQRGKQAAVLSLDEAKLAIAGAQRAEAERYAVRPLADSIDHLLQAEKKYRGGNYAGARIDARKSAELARVAQAESERKATAKKNQKRRAKA